METIQKAASVKIQNTIAKAKERTQKETEMKNVI